MQLLSAKPLIEQFRQGTFRDEQIGPYFIAYVVLESVGYLVASIGSSEWDIAAAAAGVVITVFGVLYLKRMNGDTFGHQFLQKWFALGWVIAVRVLLIAIPAAVMWISTAVVIGGEDAIAPASAVFSILAQVGVFWWIGSLIQQAKRTEEGVDSPPS